MNITKGRAHIPAVHMPKRRSLRNKKLTGGDLKAPSNVTLCCASYRLSCPMLRPGIRTRHHLAHIARGFTSSAETVFIALGSNVGNRANNVHEALEALREHVEINRTSFLYESKPMYKTDQPLFLNAAVQGQTTLLPHELLRVLKRIESQLGRNENEVKNGPRPIDLDILTYGTHVINDAILKIPHPRIPEREFVLQPLHDIQPTLSTGENTVEELLDRLHATANPDLTRVTPTKSGRLLKWGGRTLLMGIINATPDSFSDGGMHNTRDTATEQVSRFCEAGFDIVDIGGQSTRPGAAPVSTDEELKRVLPILEQVVKDHPEIIVSCDTFDASVAKQALAAGADVVNDVTGGRDPAMFRTVRDTGAGMVMMHMRGDPVTMQGMVEYSDVIGDVAAELVGRVEIAMDAGIARWSIMTDPGIGFAKTAEQSAELVRGMPLFKDLCGGHGTVLGLSRKSFLRIQGECATTRDWKTAGAIGAAIALGGVDVARIHSTDVAKAVWAADLVRG